MSNNDENKSNNQPELPFEGMVDAGETPRFPVEPVDPTKLAAEDESSAPLAVYSDQPAFHPEDITPPVIKLLQALSPEVVEGAARAGYWSLAGFDAVQTLTIVPIQFARRREYREEDSPMLACVSYDGETGEGDPGGICANCVMNKWTGEGRNRKGPQCMFMYSYMVYAVEFGAVAVINFKRTGLAIGRSLNSIVARAGIGRVAVKLSAKIQQGGKGSYYVPQIQPMSAADAQPAIQDARKYLGM